MEHSMTITIKADGAAKQILDGKEAYHAWFLFPDGSYLWSASAYDTEAEADEYGRQFVVDFERIMKYSHVEERDECVRDDGRFF